MELLDIGLGNGLRNKFAQSIALGDEYLAKVYVSTSYFLLTILVVPSLYSFYRYTQLRRLDKNIEYTRVYGDELNKLSGIYMLSASFCIQFVDQIIITIYIAYQNLHIVILYIFYQIYVTLIVIYFLTISTSGSLLSIGIASSGAPIIILSIASIYVSTLLQGN